MHCYEYNCTRVEGFYGFLYFTGTRKELQRTSNTLLLRIHYTHIYMYGKAYGNNYHTVYRAKKKMNNSDLRVVTTNNTLYAI